MELNNKLLFLCAIFIFDSGQKINSSEQNESKGVIHDLIKGYRLGNKAKNVAQNVQQFFRGESEESTPQTHLSQQNISSRRATRGTSPQKVTESKSSQTSPKFTRGRYDFSAQSKSKQDVPEPIEPQSTLPDSWTATKALLYNTGTSIVGPTIETLLWAIGGIVKSASDALSDSLAGEHNKGRRDTIYAGITGALVARGLYAWSTGKPFWGNTVTNWWNNTFYSNPQVVIQGNQHNPQAPVNQPIQFQQGQQPGQQQQNVYVNPPQNQH